MTSLIDWFAEFGLTNRMVMGMEVVFTHLDEFISYY